MTTYSAPPGPRERHIPTLVCNDCGSLVTDPERHNAWHDDMAEARWQGMAAYERTGGLT